MHLIRLLTGTSRVFIASLIFTACNQHPSNADSGWEIYGANKSNNRYVNLRQIDTTNVQQLTIAWTYHSNDADSNTQIQVNPVVIDTVLYGISPKLKLFALHAATGKQLWVYDPVADSVGEYRPEGSFAINASRGLAVYKGKGERRLFYSANGKLYCINGFTGEPFRDFGDHGRIDLHQGLGRKADDLYVAGTTPGIIYKDLIIVGMRVAEESVAAPGHIRAYDVHSGKQQWIFHTIPQPGEAGFETWQDSTAYRYVGGANCWAGFSLDEEKGIVFAPTGSAVYDFYGGKRKGENLYANCVLALDAGTGKRVWHFQTMHHDVWDRDLPSAPVLVNITKDGKQVEALAQVSKTGFIYLFDRATGVPVYPIPEIAVPVSPVLDGEQLSPTQPIPSFPKPFTRQVITAADLNRLVPDSSFRKIAAQYDTLQKGNMFMAPSRSGTLIFPGFDGGAEWGGPAYDPETAILYVNANEVPWILTMVDNNPGQSRKQDYMGAGNALYKANCMNCHGPDRKGSGNYPSLVDAGKKYPDAAMLRLLNTGRRMMPSFNHLSMEEKRAIISFVRQDAKSGKLPFVPSPKAEDAFYQLPYNATGYHKFKTPEGYPAINPPWGTLNAVDLNTGEIRWRVPLGDYPELKSKGIHSGTENYGGPVVTAGGLVIIAASSDRKIRAFHKGNGMMLWEADLPAPGFATPAVYQVNGKQYITIACGGGKLGKPGGDAYITFALP
ncbi:outer membrane protein assembly factor BamB family protein [Flavihumibacter petaseus]|uniref:Putative oxidoreductase n=1 Tax=Flavihumibacter petaseus NBRC 106054 TaxID=1220578 RepID=A0A0E9N4F4_9BACT|nr:PQQ-binding-like beta-propeller repeat protein [Flavihumibacter petaseus]GAO44857.1 putative oxidoreductase [Flavihumibacter petaseus NBRC 106054]